MGTDSRLVFSEKAGTHAFSSVADNRKGNPDAYFVVSCSLTSDIPFPGKAAEQTESCQLGFQTGYDTKSIQDIILKVESGVYIALYLF